jgi:phospholipase C
MSGKASLSVAAAILISVVASATARAHGDINKLNHIVIVVQENHSFDNYLGVLPYAPGTPYHRGPCHEGDHGCVDGLTCTRSSGAGVYTCQNSNPEADGTPVAAFHSTDYCVATDLDHSWIGTHRQGNFEDPNSGLLSSPNDGFVQVNDQSNQPDNGTETVSDDETMSFYNESDLPSIIH